MSQYLGGIGLVIGLAVAYATTFVPQVPLWAAAPTAALGLVIGHFVDPHTRWGPNKLPDPEGFE